MIQFWPWRQIPRPLAAGSFIDLTIEADYCIDGYGVIDGVIGDDLADRFSRWTKLLGS